MTHPDTKHTRILAIAPSTRGFGFAVLEGQEILVNWGVKSVQGNKNTQSLVKVKEMIVHYQPRGIVLEDTLAKEARRAPRIRALTKKIIALASSSKVKVVLFSQQRIRQSFFTDGHGTKHALAEILAKRFPEELALRLPPKRRPWVSEDSRMKIFDAVALVLAFQLRTTKQARTSESEASESMFARSNN